MIRDSTCVTPGGVCWRVRACAGVCRTSRKGNHRLACVRGEAAVELVAVGCRARCVEHRTSPSHDAKHRTPRFTRPHRSHSKTIAPPPPHLRSSWCPCPSLWAWSPSVSPFIFDLHAFQEGEGAAKHASPLLCVVKGPSDISSQQVVPGTPSLSVPSMSVRERKPKTVPRLADSKTRRWGV